MIDIINHKVLRLGIIIKASFKNEGIEFFTNDNDSQQLGYMTRDVGHEIIPHRHNIVKRKVEVTQEVLFIKSGQVRVDFYDNNEQYLKSRVLNKGDIILLIDGGHGFVMLEKSEIIEVKQGPYCGEKDKVRFKQENKKINYE